MTDSELHAKHTGKLKIGDVEADCAVLNNDRRVIVQRKIVLLLTGNEKGGLGRYFKPKNLQPYIPEKFRSENWDDRVIEFHYGGVIAQAFDAEDLIDICNMYIKAAEDNALLPSQKKIAINASRLVRGFAKVGLVALIDEATGYQKFRHKDALRILVEYYVREDAREWTKEFNDDFFNALDEIYDNPKTHPRTRPKYYGNFINNYIYIPIENGAIFPKIKELQGAKRHKRLHQFLNEEKGLQVLRNRIGRITALLVTCDNMDDFIAKVHKMDSKQKWFDFSSLQGT